LVVIKLGRNPFKQFVAALLIDRLRKLCVGNGAKKTALEDRFLKTKTPSPITGSNGKPLLKLHYACGNNSLADPIKKTEQGIGRLIRGDHNSMRSNKR
jgi:hypothetical protein